MNVGYDITSGDPRAGEFRLIEVNGLARPGAGRYFCPRPSGAWPHDRRACYWLYLAMNCAEAPERQEPIRGPARSAWHEVQKVQHYYQNVAARNRPFAARKSRGGVR